MSSPGRLPDQISDTSTPWKLSDLHTETLNENYKRQIKQTTFYLTTSHCFRVGHIFPQPWSYCVQYYNRLERTCQLTNAITRNFLHSEPNLNDTRVQVWFAEHFYTVVMNSDLFAKVILKTCCHHDQLKIGSSNFWPEAHALHAGGDTASSEGCAPCSLPPPRPPPPAPNKACLHLPEFKIRLIITEGEVALWLQWDVFSRENI